MTKSTWITTVFLVFFCYTDSYGQKKLIMKADSVLRNRYYNARIDTNYLQRPDKRWNIRVGNNFSSSGISMMSKQTDYEYKAELNADLKVTAQVKVSYSGLSLSLSINPASMKGRNTDWGINFNSSGRKFGADVTASISKTMKGLETYAGKSYDLRTGDVQQRQLYATGYYAFNDRRFAYAAAFNQSYIQKRSAGSWLLSTAIYASTFTSEETIKEDNKLKHFDIAFGGGYGYNWVPYKGWLLHISGTPTLCLYSHSSLEMDGKYEKMKMHFPEFIIIGKGAIVYQHKNWFFGANMIYYTTVNGDENKLQVLNTRWYARNFIGFRF